MVWEIEYTDEFEAWWNTLTETEQRHLDAAVQVLANAGPNLGRPVVDTITSSRHANMKELRTSSMRTLFAFDPRRTAILLIGGDKAGAWDTWYTTAIPEADDLYDTHLETLKQEGEI